MSKYKIYMFSLFAIVAGSASIYGQRIAAVNLQIPGDYVSSTVNHVKPTTVITGDFDFDGNSDDSSIYMPLGSTLSSDPFSSKGLKFGFQISTNDSLSATNTIGLFRTLELLTTNDYFQVSNAAGTGFGRMALTATVDKANFAAGASSISNLGISPVSDGVNAFARIQNSSSGSLRFIIKEGSQWYVSATSTTGTINYDIASDSFYAVDLSSNLLLDTSTLTGGGVLGSTFTNIQSFGIHHQTNSDVDFANANAALFGSREYIFGVQAVPEMKTSALFLGAFAILAVVIRRKLSK